MLTVGFFLAFTLILLNYFSIAFERKHVNAAEERSELKIIAGISSGTNVAAAIRLAKILGKGKTVVTVLPDTAERYFSTPLFD